MVIRPYNDQIALLLEQNEHQSKFLMTKVEKSDDSESYFSEHDESLFSFLVIHSCQPNHFLYFQENDLVS